MAIQKLFTWPIENSVSEQGAGGIAPSTRYCFYWAFRKLESILLDFILIYDLINLPCEYTHSVN